MVAREACKVLRQVQQFGEQTRRRARGFKEHLPKLLKDGRRRRELLEALVQLELAGHDTRDAALDAFRGLKNDWDDSRQLERLAEVALAVTVDPAGPIPEPEGA